MAGIEADAFDGPSGIAPGTKVIRKFVFASHSDEAALLMSFSLFRELGIHKGYQDHPGVPVHKVQVTKTQQVLAFLDEADKRTVRRFKLTFFAS